MDFGLIVLLLVFLAVGLYFGYLLGKAITAGKFSGVEKDARADAVQRSRAVLGGQLNEQVAPLLPGFPGKPTEARFLGKPVDFIIFNGLDDKHVESVSFVEVKTGAGKLSPVEKSVKDAVTAGKVTWKEYRPPEH